VDALPDWLTPLPDAATMRAVDRWAIDDRGVPGIDLMERAGTAVARAAELLAADGTIGVVCGKGNNGGDGLVVARLLREAGRDVRVVCVAPPSDYGGDALVNLERLPGPPPLAPDGSEWSDGGAAPSASGAMDAVSAGEDALIVDALLGTGFAGEPHGSVAHAIAAINARTAPVVSVDVPSGVDASTGQVAGAAVNATATVTFHAAKPGLWIMPGKAHAGDVETVDIGIPRGAPLAATIGLIGRAVVDELPRRTRTSTKFSSGQLVVAGGSRGLTGAPTLAARAGMRAGAGYVIACVPASQQPLLAGSGTPEMMTRALDEDNDGGLAESAVEQVLALAGRGALALGPGLGREPAAVAFARRLATAAHVPLVLDADGLNAHAGELDALALRGAATVLTPHAGEMGRLLGCDSDVVERERLRCAREAARRAAGVVVLKGDDTLVCAPDGRVAVSAAGTPALATAGTGDVLAGVIGALLAQGVEMFAAACAGVYLHARAGARAAETLGVSEGVIAGDVIASLPGALGAARRAAAGEGASGG
jgi:NAD(P)H-hydrate epimerase